MTAAKRVLIKCPECGSVNVRAGKADDDTMKCTCRACGLRFDYDVVKEEVVTPKSNEE